MVSTSKVDVYVFKMDDGKSIDSNKAAVQAQERQEQQQDNTVVCEQPNDEPHGTTHTHTHTHTRTRTRTPAPTHAHAHAHAHARTHARTRTLLARAGEVNRANPK